MTRGKHSGIFTWQAIKDAVERMKPELIAASEAAHKAKEADQDDPDYTAFDRTVELGYLVECLGGLCGPHLLLLNEIADALHELHDAEEGHGQKTPHQQH
jgi:SpoU rRNA methylase family enzyme